MDIKHQWRYVICIALVFALRVFGFMAILPVLSLHAGSYSGASAKMVGLAIGIYGLVQALCQIPMGSWSDRIGRRPIVLIGLTFMLIGSLIAAYSHSMLGIVLGRGLQGAGAIGSTLNAWCADLTTSKMRTKAMALIGMSIGVTFMLAMVVGPIIVSIWQVKGLFFVTALLACIAMGVVQWSLPSGANDKEFRHKTTLPELFKMVVSDRNLIKLDLGILILHAVYTSCFMVLPVVLSEQYGHLVPLWLLYLPLLVVAALVSIPGVIMAEAKGKMREVFLFTILLMAFVQIGLVNTHFFHYWLLVMLWLFFTGFTLLESLLPSLASKSAPVGSKGTAMGVFSCSQYLGIFIGGVVGGWLSTHVGSTGIYWFSFGLILVWYLLALTMKMPASWTERSYSLIDLDKVELQKLLAKIGKLKGVCAVKWVDDETRIYLKVDSDAFKEDACLELLKSK